MCIEQRATAKDPPLAGTIPSAAAVAATKNQCHNHDCQYISRISGAAAKVFAQPQVTET